MDANQHPHVHDSGAHQAALVVLCTKLLAYPECSMALMAHHGPVQHSMCWSSTLNTCLQPQPRQPMHAPLFAQAAASCPDALCHAMLAAKRPSLAFQGQLVQGQLLWRGPRVRMGMFEGRPAAVVPHPASGRADYFGRLCNRCCSQKAHCTYSQPASFLLLGTVSDYNAGLSCTPTIYELHG